MPAPAIEVMNLSKRYGKVQALENVSFAVPEGEIFGYLGPNGAGKSTTLKAISGLTPPASGEIKFEGMRIDRVPAHRIVEMGIAHIPEGRRLWPGLSVR